MNAAADCSQADDTCLSQYRYLLDIALRSVDIPIICGVGRSAGSTHFPHPSTLSLPFPFPGYTAGDLEILPDLS